MLHDFLTQHRDAIIERARGKAAARQAPLASPAELTQGIPAFLGELVQLLRAEERAHADRTTDEQAQEAIGGSADQQGHAQLRAGMTVAQVVEGYGDVCQSITEHAAVTHTTITADEYRTLNLCLDVATARAVTAFSSARDRHIEREEAERLGVLAHEMRNLLSSALLSYQALLKRGAVGNGSGTGALLGRSLRGLQALVDRSLTEVRLAAALRNPERVPVAQFIEETEVSATLDAKAKGLALNVPPVDPDLAIHVDRPLLASAVGNLVQNAIKFTPAGGRVALTARGEAGRVLIEVEDQCGGLAEGHAEAMFRPFDRRATDRKGLGLGLKISHDAVTANGGEIRVRNLPGRGCVFTVALPSVE